MTRRSVAVLAAAVLAIVPGAAGCGSDDEPAATTSTPSEAAGPTTGAAPAASPQATEPTVATPTTTAATTPTTTATGPTATTGEPTTTGESGAGGGGDEEPARVPVLLTAAGGALSPTTVTVPAFLTVEIRIAGRDGATKATISAPGGGTLDVPAGGTAVKRLTGLKPGDYTVTTAAGGKTTLHVVNGGDPGP